MISTLDTNVAIYTLSPATGKAQRAAEVMAGANFVSVQLLNEFAHVARRKFRFDWAELVVKLTNVRELVGTVLPVDTSAHDDAIRLASRYMLSFYDSLMLSVALTGGARIFYSEDMQHGLVIDQTLTIVNPFLPDPA